MLLASSSRQVKLINTDQSPLVVEDPCSSVSWQMCALALVLGPAHLPLLSSCLSSVAGRVGAVGGKNAHELFTAIESFLLSLPFKKKKSEWRAIMELQLKAILRAAWCSSKFLGTVFREAVWNAASGFHSDFLLGVVGEVNWVLKAFH